MVSRAHPHKITCANHYNLNDVVYTQGDRLLAALKVLCLGMLAIYIRLAEAQLNSA